MNADQLIKVLLTARSEFLKGIQDKPGALPNFVKVHPEDYKVLDEWWRKPARDIGMSYAKPPLERIFGMWIERSIEQPRDTVAVSFKEI